MNRHAPSPADRRKERQHNLSNPKCYKALVSTLSAALANIAAPWMVLVFVAFGVVGLRQMGLKSVGDFWRIASYRPEGHRRVSLTTAGHFRFAERGIAPGFSCGRGQPLFPEPVSGGRGLMRGKWLPGKTRTTTVAFKGRCPAVRRRAADKVETKAL